VGGGGGKIWNKLVQKMKKKLVQGRPATGPGGTSALWGRKTTKNQKKKS